MFILILVTVVVTRASNSSERTNSRNVSGELNGTEAGKQIKLGAGNQESSNASKQNGTGESEGGNKGESNLNNM